jgi:flagellar export protein FliJ
VATFRFRFQRLLDQKLRQKEDAARIVATRQRESQAEQDHLAALELQVHNLEREILTTRLTMLGRSKPVFARNLMQLTEYLSGLHHDAEDTRKASVMQDHAVDEATAKLNQAREHLANSSREAETLKKFRDKLAERFHRDTVRREEIELDEAGIVLFLNRSRNQ